MDSCLGQARSSPPPCPGTLNMAVEEAAGPRGKTGPIWSALSWTGGDKRPGCWLIFRSDKLKNRPWMYTGHRAFVLRRSFDASCDCNLEISAGRPWSVSAAPDMQRIAGGGSRSVELSGGPLWQDVPVATDGSWARWTGAVVLPQPVGTGLSPAVPGEMHLHRTALTSTPRLPPLARGPAGCGPGERRGVDHQRRGPGSDRWCAPDGGPWPLAGISVHQLFGLGMKAWVTPSRSRPSPVKHALSMTMPQARIHGRMVHIELEQGGFLTPWPRRSRAIPISCTTTTMSSRWTTRGRLAG